MNGIDILWESINVVNDITEVGREDNLGDLSTKASKLLIGWLEGSLGLGWEVKDEDGLINLDGLSTSSLQLGKKLFIDWHEFVQEVNRIDSLATVWLAESKEGNWAYEDRSGDDPGFFGLEELSNSLWAGAKLEGLVVLEGWLDVMVIRVEPFHHFQARDIDTILLTATTHSKVFIDGVEAVLGISLGCSLSKRVSNWCSAVACGGGELTPKSWIWVSTWS